jgi:predicted MPP superfamily phosphohydrolase
MPATLPKVALLAGAVAAAGAACVGYGVLVERDWYRLRRERVRALEPGQPPLTVLHLSDLHLTVADTRRLAFLERLAAEPVDLVVLTGDMLGEPAALGPVLEALGRFRPRLGAVAVLGSNDYWAPRFRNPLGYFRGPSSRRKRSSGRNPWRELVDGLEARGWTVLSNRRDRLADVELAGMDDPHIRRDDPGVAVPADGCAWGWCTAPTGGPWTPSRATATAWCWPGTPTAARSACPGSGPW